MNNNNNNNGNKRKKNNKEKKDKSAGNKVKKQQKTKRKTDVVNMSTSIVDIEDTPDVATWNKNIHIKDDAAGIVDDIFHDAEEIQTKLTTGVGIRDRNASKKDLIADPANRKEVEEAIESGSTLTDEATDLS
ncbi:MAG: hypothetical protein JO297_19015 [Nitrososphaeraceae archaeon]|nr:hypothetical protein [Nitrososphaeraceae archaeon]